MCAYSKHTLVLLNDGNIVPISELKEGDVLGVPFDIENDVKEFPVVKGFSYQSDTELNTYVTLVSSLGTSVSATSEQLVYASKECKYPYELMEIEEVCRSDCIVHYGHNLIAHVVQKFSWKEEGIYSPIVTNDKFYITNDPFKTPILVSSK
jgi:hypothetical protein